MGVSVQPFHVPPAGAVDLYQSYELRRPATGDFWRRATCEEVDCPHWKNGWTTTLDTSTPLGATQATYIRVKSGRQFEAAELLAGMVTFTFAAGQECFGSSRHRLPRERDPIALVRDGDWRGNPTGNARRFQVLADWRDSMQETLGAIADAKQKG